MTDPDCLLDSSTDDFERALLGSAKQDVGSPAARARCLAAVSPGLALLAVTPTASAAVLLPVLKAVGVGLVLGAAVSGGAFIAMTERSVGTNVAPAPPPAPAQIAVSAPPTRDAAPTAIPPRVERPVPASPRVVATPPSIEAPAVSLPADQSLAREVADLDGARQKLTAGEAERALASLDHYSREFPVGVLLPEATYLRVRALLASGQRARAAQVGRSFLATHGAGAGSRKLSELLEQENLR